MIAVGRLLLDALQISTGLARVRNLSARSEGDGFCAASGRNPAEIPNLYKQAPQRLGIDRQRDENQMAADLIKNIAGR